MRLRGQEKAGITSESKTLRHFDRFFRLELKSCLRSQKDLLGSLLSSQRLLSRTCLFFSNGRSTFTSNLYATKGRESEIVFLVILKNSLCSYRTCYQSNIRRQSKGIINESRSAARGRVDRCPARAAAAVSAADPTFRAE